MGDDVVIRNARVKDSKKALPVWDEFMDYHRRVSTMDSNLVKNAGEMWLKYFERHVRSRTRKAIVAERNGEIVGYLIGELQKRPPIFETPRQAYIDNIGVLERERNKGIGSLMLEAFAEWAKEKKMPSIILNVVVENNPAIRLYEKHGYKTTILTQRKLL